MCTLFSFGNQSQVISSRSSIQGGFLVLAVGIQRRREIIGFGYQFLLQIVYRTLGACQITLVFEILGRHHQRQCCRRRATTAGIHDREIILELAREAAVLVLQLEEAVQHALDAFLPFGVFTLLLFLVVQIVQNGIYAFGLTADAMSGFLEAAVVVYHFVEETGRRKTVLEISVKDMIGIVHQVLAVLLFAILQSIESVQQCTSHKAHFGNIGIGTSSSLQLYTGIIMSGGIANIAFHEEVAHHLLHAVYRVRCVNRFRTVSVITILPGALYAFRKIGSIPFGHLPSHGDAVTLTKQLESLNGRSQRQFADICLRCFLIGETVCQDSHTIHIAETGISDGSLTGQDYLSLLMSGQSFLVELVNTDNRHGRTTCRIESCRQRSAQTVLTHQPTVRCVERRGFLRRTQVAAIPEARHVELAV